MIAEFIKLKYSIELKMNVLQEEKFSKKLILTIDEYMKMPQFKEVKLLTNLIDNCGKTPSNTCKYTVANAVPAYTSIENDPAPDVSDADLDGDIDRLPTYDDTTVPKYDLHTRDGNAPPKYRKKKNFFRRMLGRMWPFQKRQSQPKPAKVYVL